MSPTEQALNDFATLIYILVEVECEVCRLRLDGPTEVSEAAVWRWAQQTARGACQAGWHLGQRAVLCPECAKTHPPAGGLPHANGHI